MVQEKVCQFYVVIGDNNSIRATNDGDVYIFVTSNMDMRTISDNIFNKYYEMQNLNIKVNNKIIFLIPSKEFESGCYEIMRVLNINGSILYISEFERQKLAGQNNNNEINNNIYYLDDNNYIWDSNHNFVGEVGKNGIWVDYNTNRLINNGKIEGAVEIHKNVGGHGTMSGGGGGPADAHVVDLAPKKVLSLKPPKRPGSSAAFVSLPAIMFVLSAMLLIGSVILLFVLK